MSQLDVTDTKRSWKMFDRLSKFFVWNIDSDEYGDACMDVTHIEKQIVIIGEASGQTLILNLDGTWEIT